MSGDLASISEALKSNPLETLISACHNDPAAIQDRYNSHRLTRISQQRSILLEPTFPGVDVDPILYRLETTAYSQDSRHGLVFSAKPPATLKKLIRRIQQELKDIAPLLWVAPAEQLHMTALEITNSRTSEEIGELVNKMQGAIEEITEYTAGHRARVIKPMLSYDTAAVALSFLPAAGEALSQHSGRETKDDVYTFHHLRRDLHEISVRAGIKPQSRYIAPTAHLTIGRFINSKDFENQGVTDVTKMTRWVQKIDEINMWLEKEYWPMENGIKEGGVWIVGEEKGLDCRSGTGWYGGGDTLRVGRGF